MIEASGSDRHSFYSTEEVFEGVRCDIEFQWLDRICFPRFMSLVFTHLDNTPRVMGAFPMYEASITYDELVPAVKTLGHDVTAEDLRDILGELECDGAIPAHAFYDVVISVVSSPEFFFRC